MGAVYKARQPALDRLVALKVLPPRHVIGASFPERFNREARALARLSHPNIVAVHEFGQAGDLNFFIMEYVDGASLRQLQKSSRLSPREALQIVPQICDALQYAHDEGVVHRDIKPENVLVDRKGRVKIADFGLAKILDPEASASARLTVEGQVMGTPHYMAPEQVERPLVVDHRADIYSLGVVFYEMLTGDLPLGRFPPPSRKVQVDVRLDEIVLRALENDPERRYQQASEVKEGVATVLETPAPSSSSASGDGRSEGNPKPAPRYLRWAGIPVVVERDGEREVNFNGALAAIFVTMLCAAAADMLVRWMTGSPHAMSSLVFLAAFLTVFWGFRRTLNQPWDDEPQATANGTVILRPRSRIPYLKDYLMLAGLIGLIVGLHYLKTGVIDPLRSASRSKATTGLRAQSSGTDGVWLADLEVGGRIELVAIGEPEAAPKGWWRADGTPVEDTTYSVRDISGVFAPDGRYLDLIFRLSGLPEGAVLTNFDFDRSLGSGGGGEARQGNELIPGAKPVRVAWPPDARSANIRVAFEWGPWNVVSHHDPITRSSSWKRQTGVPYFKYVLHEAVDTTQGLQATFLVGEGDPDWRVQMVAIDLEGRELPATSSRGTMANNTQLATFVFGGLKLASVRALQVRARPFHWVEFPNVALAPKTPVPAPLRASFGATTVVAFEELLDLDTGRVGSFLHEHANHADANAPFAELDEPIAWMQEQGFDVEARHQSLGMLGMRIAYLDLRDWDALTPGELGYRLRELGSAPAQLQPPHPNLPVTVGFRTREGATGIFQIVAYAENRPGATLRIKRVESPTVASALSEARTPQAAPGAAVPTATPSIVSGEAAAIVRTTPGAERQPRPSAQEQPLAPTLDAP